MSRIPTDILLFEKPFYLPEFIDGLEGKTSISSVRFSDDSFAAMTTDALRAAIAKYIEEKA